MAAQLVVAKADEKVEKLADAWVGQMVVLLADEMVDQWAVEMVVLLAESLVDDLVAWLVDRKAGE